MGSVGLKQFRVSTAGILLSYCVYDPESRDAILIDPHFDAINEYVEFISSHRLNPIFVVETQTHWSHPSGYPNLKSRYPRLSGTKFRDQETIAIGSFQFQVLSTPGVSREAIVLSGEQLLFTGNTLWIGSCGPGGFPDSSAAEHFQSLKKIEALVDCLILPGFDSNDLIFSTLAVEKNKNIALKKLVSENDFLQWSRERLVVPDDFFRKIHEGNVKEHVSDQHFSRLESIFRTTGQFSEENGDFSLSIGAISPEKFASKLKEHASSNAFLDVREREEFQAGHMPGTVNYPWVEVGFHLTELKAKKRIYVSCLSGIRSAWVSRTLSYLGFPDVVNVEGGFSRWQHAGLTVEKGAQ